MRSLLSVICLFMVATGSHAYALATCPEFTRAVSKSGAAAQLKAFSEAYWKYMMSEHPEWGTFSGYPGSNDRWTDQSLAAHARRDQATVCQRAALKKIARAGLKGEDRVTYDLLAHDFEESIEGQKFPAELLAVSQMDGFQIDVIAVFQAMPKENEADYENIFKRMEKLPTVIEQNQLLLQEGVKQKVTGVKAFMLKVTPQLDQWLNAKLDENPLYTPFKEMPSTMNAEAQTRLRARASELIQKSVMPAARNFRDYFVKDYIPAARENIAFSDMPNGKEWYDFVVRSYTTTKQPAEALHELGLREVERIQKGMDEQRVKSGFKGDAAAFKKFLLTDKRFYFTSAEQLLAGFRDIAKRIDPELPRLFKTLPRLTYGVRAIPDFAAKSAAAAQYTGGSIKAARAGWFEANTYDLPSRAKWEMETLTLHEGVPGHHFQIARAQEIEGLPDFRREGGYTAFAEGWALYAESLGDELGLFKDPYSKYGNLSDEMLRAVRLVVDTGMHRKGWSKNKALQYYRDHVAATDIDSEIEINRYISWPGQALAYKVGQLKFRELRELSAKELGDKFDLREFHDEVLGHGGLPMDVLEKTVREWIAKVKATKKPTKSA